MQFVIIMIVFAITGSLALFISKPILDILHINPNTLNTLLYYPLRLAVIFPVYQLVLIMVGALFGQFEFFWRLEKKMMKRLGLLRVFKIFQSDK